MKELLRLYNNKLTVTMRTPLAIVTTKNLQVGRAAVFALVAQVKSEIASPTTVSPRVMEEVATMEEAPPTTTSSSSMEI